MMTQMMFCTMLFLYEDGDAEDMNEVECRDTIVLYMNIESGDINEMDAREKVDCGIDETFKRELSNPGGPYCE